MKEANGIETGEPTLVWKVSASFVRLMFRISPPSVATWLPTVASAFIASSIVLK